MIVLYHVGGFSEEAQRRTGLRSPKPCLGPAISLKRQHALNNEMPADNVVKLDGTSPIRGEAMLCGTCRQPVHVSWLSDRRPVLASPH
jgi:hypothetical protein